MGPAFDFAPPCRTTIGFNLRATMPGTAARMDAEALGCPPCKFEKASDDADRISLAWADFGEDELNSNSR